MQRVSVAALGALLVLAGPAGAEWLAYGSRAGMAMRIVSRSGIDSARAEIRVAPDPAAARIYCAEVALDLSAACVAEVLGDVAGWVGDRIAGDCPAGVFTGLTGETWQFRGRLAVPTDFGAVWDLRDGAGEPPLDGTLASGYGVALAQFGALCPSQLAGR